MSDITDSSFFDPASFYKWDEDEGEDLVLEVSEAVELFWSEEDDGCLSEVVSFYDMVIHSNHLY